MPESFLKIHLKSLFIYLLPTLLLLITNVKLSNSQPHQPVFGFVRELRSVRSPTGLLVGDFNGDRVPDLASYNNNQIFLHYQKKDTIDWHTTPLKLEKEFIAIATARCNSDSRWDFILLNDSPPRIDVFVMNEAEQPFMFWSTNLQRTYDEMLVQDVNFDKKEDILLYGRKNLGVTVLLSNGNGTFQKSNNLFTEYTFSRIWVTDVNNDGMVDVLGVDWVKNRVLIFTSYAKMKYREPLDLQFSNEPILLSTAQLDSNKFEDVIIAVEGKREVMTFSGDAAGNFLPLFALQLPSTPTEVLAGQMSPLTGYSLIFLMSDIAQMSVYSNWPNQDFPIGITLSSGNFPTSACLFFHQLSRYKNLAMLNPKENRIRIYYNPNIVPQKQEVFFYPAGHRPNDVLDITIPGTLNSMIAISHSGSEFLSVYQQMNNGFLRGPIPVTATTLSGNLSYHVKNDTTIMIVGEHTLDNHISTIEMNINSLSSKILTFPSQHTQIIASTLSKSDNLLHLLTLEHERSRNERTIVLFNQISDNRYSEERITGIDSTNLVAVSGEFLSSKIQVSYALMNKKRKRLEMYSAYLSDNMVLSQPQLLFDIPTSTVENGYLWSMELNRDETPDFILLLGEPLDTLLCLVSSSKTKYVSTSIPQPSRVNIVHRGRLKFFDINSDNNVDIVLDNSITKTVQIYLGEGKGVFDEPYRLISSEGFGGFTLTDINMDTIPDLIISDAANGYVKVITLKDVY